MDVEIQEQNNDNKSKSLPPSRALGDSRRSSSRGAISQSRDLDRIEKKEDSAKETPEEREERQFAEKLRRTETQEERDRLLARRQKFKNNLQPIELTKKVISLKSKIDSVNDEPLNEKRLRNKNKDVGDLIERRRNDGKVENQALVTQSNKTKFSRLTSDTGDSISLGIEDTLDMFDEENLEISNRSIKVQGTVFVSNL